LKAVDKVDHGVRARGGSSTKIGANEVWLASLLAMVEKLDEITNAAIGHGAMYIQDTTTYVHVVYQIPKPFTFAFARPLHGGRHWG
jgi:hypothetical protein